MAVRVRLRLDGLQQLAEERDWIKSNGTINATAVALAAGVTLTTISRLINGDRGYCGPAVISGLLAAAPDRSFDDLFERVGKAAS